ncbi:MAG TPA: carboxypeptidase-like regulatory domain-containing protein [Bacteroidota bacterium]
MDRLPLVLIFLLPVIGCRSDTDLVAPIYAGKIAGHIRLYDDFGRQLTNSAGVSVTTAGGSIYTISDSLGFWTLCNVPTGIYDVTFSKQGYLKEKRFSIQFVGGAILYLNEIYLAQIPTVSVTSLSGITVDSNRTIEFQGTLSSSDSLGRSIAFLFCRQAPVTSTLFHYIFYESVYTFSSSTTFNSTVQFFDYYYPRYRIRRGDTLFVVAYPRSRGAAGGLVFNPASYEYEFDNPTVGFSNVITVVVP